MFGITHFENTYLDNTSVKCPEKHQKATFSQNKGFKCLVGIGTLNSGQHQIVAKPLASIWHNYARPNWDPIPTKQRNEGAWLELRTRDWVGPYSNQPPSHPVPNFWPFLSQSLSKVVSKICPRLFLLVSSCTRLRVPPCRATRVAPNFLDFIAFCRCSTGVALHPLKLGCRTSPPCAGRCRTEIWLSEKVSRYTGVSQLQLRVSRYTVQLSLLVFPKFIVFFFFGGGGNFNIADSV